MFGQADAAAGFNLGSAAAPQRRKVTSRRTSKR
jgi:hypothetical protein